MAVCPNCGKEREPFDRTSDWCSPCTRSVLDEQERMRFEPQAPEYISYLEDARSY